MISASSYQSTNDKNPAKLGLPLVIKVKDTRSDSRTRLITLTRERIVINRTYLGISMRLSVPVSAYRGLVVSVGTSAKGLICSLDLAHSDPDLSIPLLVEEGECAVRDASKALNEWRSYFGSDDCKGEAANTDSYEHRRGSLTSGRRRKHAGRRKTGQQSLLENSFAGERLIIART